MNVDIFACIYFRAFPKIGNFGWINIRDFDIFPVEYTVNVDIFACIHFRAFPKIGNFARINIRDFDIFPSM